MATGSGLSSSVGFAAETTYGVPVAATRFFEFDSESLQIKKTPIQGTGLRGGAYLAAASRRSTGTRTADGDVTMDVPSNGLGLLLSHMLGSTATATSIGGGLYQQVHGVGTLNGRSLTTQIVRAATDGDLTSAAFTYPGCKVTGWEFSVASSAELKLKLTLDARDEATASNSFASTTLSAAVTTGATSISTVAAVPAGAYIMLDTNALTAEPVRVTTVTGSGPYVATLAAGFTPLQAHGIGAVVSSATQVNYGAATALQAPTYSATRTLFNFVQGNLVAGGTTTVTGGVWSNAGGVVIGNVTGFTLTGANSLDTSRFGMGTAVKSEPIENGWRGYSCTADMNYNNRLLYDAYIAEAPVVLQLTFATPAGAILKFVIPAAYQDDGVNPVVGGPTVISIKPKWTILDDGVNGALQVVYTSTDATV
jgi:hypothetical protein